MLLTARYGVRQEPSATEGLERAREAIVRLLPNIPPHGIRQYFERLLSLADAARRCPCGARSLTCVALVKGAIVAAPSALHSIDAFASELGR